MCVQAHPSILPRRSSRRGLKARGVVAFLGATCRQQPSPHPHARSSLFVLRHGRHSYVSGLQECPHAAPLEAGLSRPLLFVSTSPAASGQHTRQNRQRSDRTRRHNIELPHARGVCRLKKKQRGVQEAMHSGIGTIQAPWPLPHGLTSAVSKKRCPHAAAPRRSSRPLLFFFASFAQPRLRRAEETQQGHQAAHLPSWRCSDRGAQGPPSAAATSTARVWHRRSRLRWILLAIDLWTAAVGCGG